MTPAGASVWGAPLFETSALDTNSPPASTCAHKLPPVLHKLYVSAECCNDHQSHLSGPTVTELYVRPAPKPPQPAKKLTLPQQSTGPTRDDES
jgi:hypothetical protein